MPKCKIDTTPKIMEAVKKIYKQKLEGHKANKPNNPKNVDLVFSNKVKPQLLLFDLF
jgi:hypothetical protein